MYSKHSLTKIVVESSLVSKKNYRLHFEMMQQNTSFKKIVKTLGAQWDEFLTKIVFRTPDHK